MFLQLLKIFSLSLLSFTPVFEENKSNVGNYVDYEYIDDGYALVTNLSNTKALYKDNQLIYNFNKSVDYLETIGDNFYFSHIIENVSLLEIYNYQLNTTLKLTLEDILVYDVVKYNDYILVVGETNKNGIIKVFDLNMNFCKDFIYGGDYYESFRKAVVYNNSLFVSGDKDAHTYDEHFQNSGNVNEIKSFVTKINSQFIIEKVALFNEQEVNEYAFNLEAKNHLLYQQKGINTTSYLLDENLNILSKESFKESAISYQTLKKDSTVINVLYSNKIEIMVHGKIIYTINGYYLDSCFHQGKLQLIYKENHQVVMLNLQEYHSLNNHPLICDRLNFDINSTSFLETDSYFEDLCFEIINKDPLYAANDCGKYIGEYVAIREDGGKITIKRQIFIKDFVNIIDQGIYKKGTILSFFGTAYLNDERIFNGKELNKIGENKLVIVDNLGEKSEFTIFCVEDYYKTNDHFNLDTDYYVEQLETINIEFLLKTQDLVKSVIINDCEYSNFIQTDNQLVLSFVGKAKYSVDSYRIQKIIFENYEKDIYENITITTKKAPFSIDYKDAFLNNIVEYTFLLSDSDYSFIGLETCAGDKSNVFYDKGNIEINSPNVNNIINVLYENGTNKIKRFEIFSIQLKDPIADSSIVAISTENKNGNILIKISVEVFNKNAQIDSLKILQKKVLLSINSYSKISYILVIVSVTILVFGIIFTFVFKKKKKCH